ncbi:MAG TPA: hypothetical protein VK540_27315 [Polyangiaceae bacterium]|nr:hypothetical protein [Polyangiaceae bacterium]
MLFDKRLHEGIRRENIYFVTLHYVESVRRRRKPGTVLVRRRPD